MEIESVRNTKQEQCLEMVKSGEDHQSTFQKDHIPCKYNHCKNFDKCKVCKDQFGLESSIQMEGNQCKYCNKIFRNNTEKKDMCEYCENYKDYNVSTDQFELEPNSLSKENQCEYCKITFKSSTNKKHRCEYCDSTLKKQVKKRFRCDKCDTNFTNQGKKKVSSKICDKKKF